MIARSVATVGSATLLSRVLGFVRDIAIAGLFGAGARADAFLAGFQFINLLRRILTEGALNAAFVPLYLRRRSEQGENAAAGFAGALLGTAILVSAALALVLPLVMPIFMLVLAPGFHGDDARMNAAIEMGRLMLPYLAFAGPLAVLMGVLNANKRFAVAAFAAALFNLVLLVALGVIFASQANNTAGNILAASVAIAGLCQLVLVAGAIRAGSERVTPIAVSFGPQFRHFVWLAVPGLVAGGLPQLMATAGVMVASASDSAVSWIYYANRLVELPLGIVGVAVGTVLVPAFSHAVRANDGAALIAAESRGLELTLGLALPAAIGLALLAEPIVRVLFERGAFTVADSKATAAALTAFALGLPGHVLVKAFSPVFFAREDTATPMRAALIGFVLAVTGALLLMPVLGHVGIALAIAAGGWISAAILWLAIRRRIGFSLDRAAQRRLPLIALASVLMGGAILATQAALAAAFGDHPPTSLRIVGLVVLIAAGMACYAIFLRVFGAARLSDLRAILRAKR